MMMIIESGRDNNHNDNNGNNGNNGDNGDNVPGTFLFVFLYYFYNINSILQIYLLVF